MTFALPNRRPHFIGPTIAWGGARWLVGVGFDEGGRAVEVFADLADTEVEVDGLIVTLVHEASITASHLLQAGVVTAAQHAARLDAPAPGILCLMLRRAAETEAELGADVGELLRWVAERRATGTVPFREFAGLGVREPVLS